jgi:hypothetical protein
VLGVEYVGADAGRQQVARRVEELDGFVGCDQVDDVGVLQGSVAFAVRKIEAGLRSEISKPPTQSRRRTSQR